MRKTSADLSAYCFADDKTGRAIGVVFFKGDPNPIHRWFDSFEEATASIEKEIMTATAGLNPKIERFGLAKNAH